MTVTSTMDDAALTGPRSWYRPKERTPLSVSLTREGWQALGAATARTGASRSDVVEQLLRRFGAEASFPPPERA